MRTSRVLTWVVGWFAVLLLTAPLAVSAQDGQADYSREQLTQMVAPIALYPDALLSQVLMAATYPLEVVEAERWLKKNPLLTGANLDEALADQNWDASVKALCQVPEVLGLMSERLEETTTLGNAFLAQESEMMDVIQELRARAYREGNLRSNDKLKVTLRDDGTIVIEPADPQTVYVPYYNTREVYGPWWYPGWYPWYWGPEVAVGGSIYFWPGYYGGFGLGFGFWSYFDWPGRVIIIDVHRRPHFYHHDNDWNARQGGWHHDPLHRRGVVYRDRDTAARFGQLSGRDRVYDREVRGYPGAERGERPSGEGRRDQIGRGDGSGSGGRVSEPGPGVEPRKGVVTPERTNDGINPPRIGAPEQGERSGGRVPNQQDGGPSFRRESGPERAPAPVPSVPSRSERVYPAPGSGGESAGRSSSPRERDTSTLFGGMGSGRDENRSSIRGSESRGSMWGNGGERGGGPSSSGQMERGGGGRGDFRR